MPEPCQVENRFAQCLAGDGASVDANAADHLISVHHGHALAKLCRGDCALLSRWPTSDYDQVVRTGCIIPLLPASRELSVHKGASSHIRDFEISEPVQCKRASQKKQS